MSPPFLSALLSLLLFYGYAYCNTVMFNPCRSQIDTTPEEQRLFLDNWQEHGSSIVLDRSFRCFATCILYDMHIMDEDGQLHMEQYMVVEAQKASWNSSVAKCQAEFGDELDSCGYGYGMANCLLSLRAARK
ncbi:general odorant-binding protein 57e [Drosophila guanche]|uniref:general odorant-binding protein 57e n=1 Tax=Drosophila guanche TaxID=7266 RepID=UPI0014717D9E|nr:general odorant-binding protein 57e [Drosophila guanche]